MNEYQQCSQCLEVRWTLDTKGQGDRSPPVGYRDRVLVGVWQ